MGILRKYRETKAKKKQYKAYVNEGDKLSEFWKPSSIPSSRDLEGAVESYTKAIEMKIYEDKPDYMIHYKRACAYEKMKKMEQAADDFRVFLSADDRKKELSKTKAISDFERAIALKKDHALIEQAGKWKKNVTSK